MKLFLLGYRKVRNAKSAPASCFPFFPSVPSTSMLLGGWQGGLEGPPPSDNPFGEGWLCPGTLEQEGIHSAAPGGLVQVQPTCFTVPAFDFSICFLFWFS